MALPEIVGEIEPLNQFLNLKRGLLPDVQGLRGTMAPGSLPGGCRLCRMGAVGGSLPLGAACQTPSGWWWLGSPPGG